MAGLVAAIFEITGTSPVMTLEEQTVYFAARRSYSSTALRRT